MLGVPKVAEGNINFVPHFLQNNCSLFLFSLYASFIDFFQCHQQQKNMDNIPRKPQSKNFIGAIIKGQCMSFTQPVIHKTLLLSRT